MTRTSVKVISLPSSNERRDAFRGIANETTLDWDFFDALSICTPELINSTERQRALCGRPLTMRELAVYSSHFTVWTQFVNDKSADQLLVLEDDVVPDWHFISKIAGRDFGLMGIDYLKLFNKVPVRQKRIVSPFLSPYFHLMLNLGLPLGAQAYILSKDGAKALVAHANPICEPIDGLMDRSWKHRLPSLSIFPAPVFERSIVSTVGEARFLHAERRPERRLRTLTERVMKVIYTRLQRVHVKPSSEDSW